MLLRAEYSVGVNLRFLGNLDMMRLMQRALRRAQIPYALSRGFNPHIKLSLGTVLPVGLWGEKEYFDIELSQDMEPQDFLQSINDVLPLQMSVNECINISAQEPALMKIINSASYRFCIQKTEIDLQKIKAEILNSEAIIIKSKGKKKGIDKDLRPGIFKATVHKSPQFDIMEIWSSIGTPLNVRYDELLAALVLYGIGREKIIDIYRSGNYIKKGAKYSNPMKR